MTARVTCDRGHEHPLCVQVRRQVHPSLRCNPTGGGVSSGHGASHCQLPDDLRSRVEYELRENFEEARRRGWVAIAA
ncbi:MAG: hypothetical protein IPL43_07235 [Micropruina sp.]|nr:hypothetical protein [Micropruina sp.]